MHSYFYQMDCLMGGGSPSPVISERAKQMKNLYLEFRVNSVKGLSIMLPEITDRL